MLIDCPGCTKSYHIIKAALGPNGRRVACPRCDTIWFVTAQGSANEIAPAMPATIEISAADVNLRTRLKNPSTKAIASPPRPAPLPDARPSFLPNLCTGTALLAACMAIIGFRAEMVRLWPPVNAAYAALGLPVNLLGLELRNLHTVSTHDGQQAVLGIEGEIANVGSRETAVPPIELTIRDRDGDVLYSWTAKSQKRRLGVGEIILFRARLAAPPAGAHEILARFAPEAPETLASR
jgi:predicted Zn finger-like uncharacterized protein